MAKTIKTLHLTNSWHSASGGIGTFYRALMQAANEAARQLVLIVPGLDTRVEQHGRYARVYSIRAPRSPFDPHYRCLMPHHFPAIASLLRKEAPDLVEVCDKYTLPYAGGLLRLGAFPGYSGRPTVVGLSCERMDENIAAYVSPRGFLKRLCREYMKWLYFPLADHHIAVTEHTGGELRDASRGHKVQRGVWVAPMGVDASTFSPRRRTCQYRQSLSSAVGAHGRSVLLLYVGRLSPEKNVPLLIEVMDQLQHRPEFHMLIAGDGPLRETLRARAPRNRVHFLGHLASREQLADLYANCDVFVHPNPREPFGIAPLEAMASGLPLVAPWTGGVRTYASEENAWLAQDNALAYANACIEAAGGRCSNRVAQALKTAAAYAWPEICRGYLRLYDELHQYRLTGRLPARAPAFHSTAGNWLGIEVGSNRSC